MGFGFWGLGFGFWGLGFTSVTHAIERQGASAIPNLFGRRDLGVGFGDSVFGFRVSRVGFRV